MRSIIARCSLAALGGLILLAITASPASAHTISGPKPSNFRSRVISVTPPAPGVDVSIVDLGAKVQLANHTNNEVLVLGYEGEPYLRVGPQGVFENLNSAATYLNATVKGGVVPSDVNTDPTAPPRWKKISDGNTARWHDHRVHWMGGSLPPQVVAQPDQFHPIGVGQITFEQNNAKHTIAVALDWVPGPSPVPWIPVMVVGFVGAFVLVAFMHRERLLAGVLTSLVVVDVAHAVAFEVARPGSNMSKTLQFFGQSFVSIIVWIAAVPTVIALWRRRAEAMYGVLFVGLMIALVGGATDLPSLWKSQLPPTGAAWVTRLEVALSLGVGAGLAIGALVQIVRRQRKAAPERGQGMWLSALVVGLREDELERIAHELDVDDVGDAALRDFATRCSAAKDAFDAGGLLVTVDGSHVWTIKRTDGEVVSARGRAEPVAAQLRTSFASLLQLLAGTLTLERARANGTAVEGDEALVTAVSPCLSERGRESVS
jgi:hypothetical protein